MSHRRPVTEPTKCRSCGAEILWVVWPNSRKRMPVDAVPDMRAISGGGGDIVLTLHGGEYGELRAESVYGNGDPKRRRYMSHFVTCPQADEHRRPRQETAAKR